MCGCVLAGSSRAGETDIGARPPNRRNKVNRIVMSKNRVRRSIGDHLMQGKSRAIVGKRHVENMTIMQVDACASHIKRCRGLIGGSGAIPIDAGSTAGGRK